MSGTPPPRTTTRAPPPKISSCTAAGRSTESGRSTGPGGRRRLVLGHGAGVSSFEVILDGTDRRHQPADAPLWVRRHDAPADRVGHRHRFQPPAHVRQRWRRPSELLDPREQRIMRLDLHGLGSVHHQQSRDDDQPGAVQQRRIANHRPAHAERIGRRDHRHDLLLEPLGCAAPDGQPFLRSPPKT